MGCGLGDLGEWGPLSPVLWLTVCIPVPSQEGVTSQTSHWSRLYFMTFYIVTMVGQTLRALLSLPSPSLLSGAGLGQTPPSPSRW